MLTLAIMVLWSLVLFSLIWLHPACSSALGLPAWTTTPDFVVVEGLGVYPIVTSLAAGFSL